MGRIRKAVFDAGPLIHLNEIKALRILGIVRLKIVTVEVKGEIKGIQIPSARVVYLDGKGKEISNILIEQFQLDLGEATSIAFCKMENIRNFFTDDLEARDVAKEQGLEAHGTLALVFRAYREGLLTGKQALILIDLLYNESSLYLTKDLVEYAKIEIMGYSHR